MAQPLRWQRRPADTICFKNLNREILLLVIYALAYFAFGFLIGAIIQRFPLPLLGATDFIQDFWYSIVFKLVFLLFLPSVIFFGMWNYKWKDLSLGSTVSLKTIAAGVLMAALGFMLNISHVGGIRENYGAVSFPHLRLAIGVVMPLFVAAIPEELFFRGMLQTRLEKRYDRSIAILASTILFVSWHLSTRYMLARGVEGQAGNWGEILLNTGVPVFVVGFIFALHWSRYRNILLLIVTHWAIDVLPSVSSYFKVPF